MRQRVTFKAGQRDVRALRDRPKPTTAPRLPCAFCRAVRTAGARLVRAFR